MASAEIRQISKVVALVTGGASGLGKATVARLARNGAHVIIADLADSKGAQVAKENGDKTIFIPTDVRTVVVIIISIYFSQVTLEADVTNTLSITRERFGVLNVAVNCAGQYNNYMI